MKNIFLIMFMILLSACVTNYKVPKRVSICVNDFGAVSNDGKDDLKALILAVNYAKELGVMTRVFLKSGKYILKGKRTLKACLILDSVKNMVLDGSGSQIVVSRADTGFLSIENSSDITVKNFYVDWKELPFTQGIVTNVSKDKGTFELIIDKGFPLPSEPYFRSATHWGMLKDPKVPGKLKDNTSNVIWISDWRKQKKNTFKMILKNKISINDFTKGDSFVMLARTTVSFCSIFKSQNVTFNNIVNYTSPAVSYVGALSSDISILNCKTLLKGKRLNSANADGIHLNLCRNVRIENCVFEGIADDGVNLYGRASLIKKQLGKNQFLIFKDRFFRKGDMVCFFNPREGIKIAFANVTNIESTINQQFFILTVDKNIEGIRGNKSIQYDRDSDGDHIYNLNALSGPFLIKNCKFINSRRHGIVIQSRDGIVENNLLKNLSSNGIICYNLPTYPEGLCAQNIIIKNNQIINCGYDNQYIKWYKSAGAISMASFTVKNMRFGKWQANQNIIIKNNRIQKWRKYAISLGCAKNITVSNNTIGNPVLLKYVKNVVFEVFNATNIQIENNHIPSSKMALLKKIGVNCENVRINKNIRSK